MTDAARAVGGGVARAPGAFRRGVWLPGTFLLAVLVATPVLAVAWLAFNPVENIWPHLLTTVLPRQLQNTSLLMLGNGIGTLLVGVSSAWLVTMCRFPGRRIFEWALLLPLAIPGYVVAYVYTDLLEFAGPVQRLLRGVFGWESARDYWFPEVRSLGGAIAVMSLVLYPYVYLLARAAFLEQSVCVLEASRTLGRSAWRSFFGVALPLARPAIVVGVVLGLMETLNDFGTVDYFAVNTLTVGVFNVWLHMGNAGGAAQISLVMLAAVFGLMAIERAARRRRRFHHTSARYRPLPGYQLAGARRFAAVAVCALPILMGFVVPAAVLARNAALSLTESWTPAFLVLALNSLALAAAAAAATVLLAVFLAYALRLRGGLALRLAARVASVGYAIPGAVLAVGVLIPLARFDNTVDAFMRQAFGVSTGLLLSGTVFALVFAYVVRFLAISFGAMEASLAKVKPSMDMAARTLGMSPVRTLWRVHLPLMRGSMLAAATIVFVDTMKELPATLILRPFGFDTLATHVYQFASDELLREASLAALAIVAAGIVPVILLSRVIAGARPGRSGVVAEGGFADYLSGRSEAEA
ncbi:MAG: ABC transporter permease [Alphaproteobacteria bacterium]